MATGYLYVIRGPMCAAKTDTGLGILNEWLAACEKVIEKLGKSELKACYINYQKDNRGTNPFYSTHSPVPRGMHSSIVPIKILNLAEIDVQPYDFIMVDEGQFFSDLFTTISHWFYDLKKSIIVVGLDMNYKMEPYRDILLLAGIASKSEHRKAKCSKCIEESLLQTGRVSMVKAPYTFRLTNDKGDEVIGGTEKYMPVCYNHYVELTRMRSSK